MENKKIIKILTISMVVCLIFGIVSLAIYHYKNKEIEVFVAKNFIYKGVGLSSDNVEIKKVSKKDVKNALTSNDEYIFMIVNKKGGINKGDIIKKTDILDIREIDLPVIGPIEDMKKEGDEK